MKLFLVVRKSREQISSEIYFAGFKFSLIDRSKKFLLYSSDLPFDKYLAFKSIFDEYTRVSPFDCFLITFPFDDKLSYNDNRVVKDVLLFVEKELYPIEKRKFNYEEVKNFVEAYIDLYEKVKKALIRRNLLFAKQPIVDKNGDVCAFELLSRLYDEDSQALIYPKDYFFVLKRAEDLAHDFESQVFEKGVEYLIKTHGQCLVYHLNLSPCYLFDNFHYVEKEIFKRDLKEKLIIEVTENSVGSVIEDKDLVELVRALNDRGIKVVLDDFGEGQSNVFLILSSSFYGLKLSHLILKEYLKTLNSQSFDYNERKRVIVNSLIRLVRDLSRYNMVKVCIEGIEREEDFFKCKSVINPGYFQGFYFGKPTLLT